MNKEEAIKIKAQAQNLAKLADYPEWEAYLYFLEDTKQSLINKFVNGKDEEAMKIKAQLQILDVLINAPSNIINYFKNELTGNINAD